MSIDDAIRYVARDMSVTRDDVLRELHPSGDMLYDAIRTGGYVQWRDGRMSLSDRGLRRLEDRP